MGLDLVELVMELEEEFGLLIHDEDAEKLKTVGQTHAYIMEQTRRRLEALPDGDPARDAPRMTEAECWEKLRDIVVRVLGVRRSDVTPDANFITDLGAE